MREHHSMLTELAAMLGLEGLSPDQNDAVKLTFFDEVEVLIIWDERDGNFTFCSSVGEAALLPTPEVRLDCFERLLVANHRTVGRSHATIGLSQDRFDITLSRVWTPREPSDADRMAEAIKIFILDMAELREVLREYGQAPLPDSEASQRSSEEAASPYHINGGHHWLNQKA